MTLLKQLLFERISQKLEASGDFDYQEWKHGRIRMFHCDSRDEQAQQLMYILSSTVYIQSIVQKKKMKSPL